MGTPFRIAISASFTAEPIAPVLEFWGKQLNVEFEVVFAPYQQVLQTLLDPAGAFAANPHGANVALFRAADFAGHFGELAQALTAAARRDRASLISVICPSREPEPDWSYETALHNHEIERLYPVARKYDEAAERLGSIPYTHEYFTALGTALARRIAALALAPYKAIALDCDNTLWEGVCGEDGPDGVRLDPGRRALQQFLLEQREAGMPLCLASKNNAPDVVETFERHPEMPLRLRDFTAMRIDWEPKPGNLTSLAKELNLGLDSFIFLDDSAKECEEMREACPEVLTLQLPADASRFPSFLQHVWAFDRVAITGEDRGRADSYTQAREFGSAFQAAHSLEDFMASLALRVAIAPMEETHYARVAQLTQRTNQFNFSTVRRTEAELRALAASHEILTVHVADRFGEYGLTGAVIYQVSGGALRVDTFLLSCRVLGRGVEHKVMARLGQLAEDWVEVDAHATARNQPAMAFLESLGGGNRFAAAELRNLRWRAAATPVEHQAADQSAPQHRFLPFARIANELNTVDRIVEAMRNPTGVFDAGLSATERGLAAIWMNLLQLPSVGPDDRFFDRGGHSLLAVLLISRVRESFGVELPIDDVYSTAATLRTLAAKIEAMRAAGIDADEYEAMLAEIESLSDEEVKALLERQ